MNFLKIRKALSSKSQRQMPKRTVEEVTRDLKSDLTAQIKAAMNAKKVTVQDLADRCGQTRARMYKVLNNSTNVTLQRIAKIAVALDEPVIIRFGERNVNSTVVVDRRQSDRLTVNSGVQSQSEVFTFGRVSYCITVKPSAIMNAGTPLHKLDEDELGWLAVGSEESAFDPYPLEINRALAGVNRR